jgi:predicted acetyltransferase
LFNQTTQFSRQKTQFSESLVTICPSQHLKLNLSGMLWKARHFSITTLHETVKVTRFFSADANASHGLFKHICIRRSIVQTIALIVEVRVRVKFMVELNVDAVRIAPHHEMWDSPEQAAHYHILGPSFLSQNLSGYRVRELRLERMSKRSG